jgi:hypothetical protein
MSTNLSHHHFVVILSRVQEVLRPLVPAAKVAKPEPRATGVENRFSGLTVEEAADFATKANTNLEATLPPVVAAEIEQSDEEAEEKFSFAIHSFLKGIHEIQNIVQEAWFKRQDFTMDPMAAALLSDNSIDLVKRAEAELDLLLKRPTRFPASKFPVWCLPALLYHHYHPLSNDLNIRDAVFPSEVYIRVEDDDYDKIHANWCFWPVYTGL